MIHHGPFTIDGTLIIVDEGGRVTKGTPKGVKQWDSKRYEEIVLRELLKIEESRTGQLILASFPPEAWEHRTTILPESTMGEDSGAGFSPWLNAIEYTPAKRDPNSPFYQKEIYHAVSQPDYDLLHEICHAMQWHRGHNKDEDKPIRTVSFAELSVVGTPIKVDLKFRELGELFAITVVNIYISEKNKGLSYHARVGEGGYFLRADWENLRPIFPKGAKNLHTFDAIQQAFLTFLWHYPGLYLKLADLPTEFNPFRDYLLLEAGLEKVPNGLQGAYVNFVKGLINRAGHVMIPVERLVSPWAEMGNRRKSK